MSLRVSIVPYTNALPFLWGIEHHGHTMPIEVIQENPSDSKATFLNKEVDIALVSVAGLEEIGVEHICTDFCIGSEGKVDTVALLSQVPLEQIASVELDSESLTSVRLVQVLAKHHWGIDPLWQEKGDRTTPESIVAIGDKVFNLQPKYKYFYDLSQAWYDWTTRPFVFAVWVAQKGISQQTITAFNTMLTMGVAQRPYLDTPHRAYLQHSIRYDFGKAQQEALALFLSYLSEEKTV